jgi:hypothetical protein
MVELFFLCPFKVRSTVLGLVRDLVQEQENFIENHTPLYWAIVKRTNGPSEDDEGGGRNER